MQLLLVLILSHVRAGRLLLLLLSSDLNELHTRLTLSLNRLLLVLMRLLWLL